MRRNVWCAWWKKGFDKNAFIYHYTSFDTLLRIIDGDSFRFSPLSNTNDTTEQKVRMKYLFQLNQHSSADVEQFENYWRKWTSNSKLLCFSCDLSEEHLSTFVARDPLDVSGRGFALPRMWAQYAEKNSGVCIVINKEKLSKRAKDLFPEIAHKPVTYYDWTTGFPISEEVFLKQIKIIKRNPNSFFAANFTHDNSDFANYYFFSKFSDWATENEYRFVIPSNDSSVLYLDGIKDCIEGIVLGENIEKYKINVLREFIGDDLQIRKICFSPRKCTLQSVGLDMG